MGKLILCRGSYARSPYYMDIGDVNIYSIEELCFYIVDHLDLIIEINLSKSLINWIKNELGLEELADNLHKLKDDNANNKTLILTILNACNYYNGGQKYQIAKEIDELENLPIIQRRIKKANHFLAAKKYKEAERSYESLLDIHIKPSSSRDLSSGLSVKEYAQVLHNLGIAKIYTVGITQASAFFKQAYERNQEKESLKQYLLALKLSKQEDLFEEALVRYNISNDFIAGLYDEYKDYIKDYEASEQYNKLLQLQELQYKDEQEFYQKAYDITKDIEQKYRRYMDVNS